MIHATALKATNNTDCYSGRGEGGHRGRKKEKIKEKGEVWTLALSRGRA